jgi:hypothetical protein
MPSLALFLQFLGKAKTHAALHGAWCNHGQDLLDLGGELSRLAEP